MKVTDTRNGSRNSEVPLFPGVIGTFMGRDALSLAAAQLHLTQQDSVLLPVYTCQDVLRIFIGKCRVIFYDIRQDLSISSDELLTKIAVNSVKMVLVTNYFGFLQPQRWAIKELCRARNICVVEDCAHSLLTDGSGKTGDLAIYSFRKVLPVPDGGGLQPNNGIVPVAQFYPRYYSDALSLTAMGKAMLNIHTEKLSRAGVVSHTSRVQPLPTELTRVLPFSHFAQHGIAGVSLSDSISRRKADYLFWQQVTSTSDCVSPVFQELPAGTCPFGFPVRTKHRDAIVESARTRGIFLRVHWRVDPTLAPDCRTSHELAADMLTLPLDFDLRDKDRDILVKILAEA